MSPQSSSHVHIDLLPHLLVDPQEPSTSQGNPHSSSTTNQITNIQLQQPEEPRADEHGVPSEGMSRPSHDPVSIEQLMEMSIQQRIQQEADTQRQMEEAENRTKQLAINSKAMEVPTLKLPTLSGGDTTSDTQSQSDNGQKVPVPHPLLISQRAPPSR